MTLKVETKTWEIVFLSRISLPETSCMLIVEEHGFIENLWSVHF